METSWKTAGRTLPSDQKNLSVRGGGAGGDAVLDPPRCPQAPLGQEEVVFPELSSISVSFWTLSEEQFLMVISSQKTRGAFCPICYQKLLAVKPGCVCDKGPESRSIHTCIHLQRDEHWLPF